MTIDRDAAFAKAQKEYERRMPPEGEEECKWHPWNEEDNGPFDGRPCPECESAREAYEADAYDRWRDDQMDR